MTKQQPTTKFCVYMSEKKQDNKNKFQSSNSIVHQQWWFGDIIGEDTHTERNTIMVTLQSVGGGNGFF